MPRWLWINKALCMGIILAASFVVRADEVSIVTGGAADTDAYFVGPTGAEWRHEKNALVDSGVGKFLGSLRAFKPENLESTVTLSLDSFEGTAAGFVIGYNIFLFDTREQCFIIEGSDFPGDATQRLTRIPLSPGVSFRFDVSIRNKKIDLKVNGKSVGNFPWTSDKPVFFGLRPQRSTMRVYDFHISGTPEGPPVQQSDYLNKQQTRPVVTTAFPVDGNAEFSVYPLRSMDSGKFQAQLISIDDKNNSLAFEITLKEDGKCLPVVHAVIPSGVLRRVYKSVKTDFVLKPFRLIIGPPTDPMADQTVILSDPTAACDYPKSEVRMVQESPRWLVNGKSSGMMYGVVVRDAGIPAFRGGDVRQFAEAGMTLFPIYVDPYQFMQPDGRFDRIRFQRDLEECILRFISEAPNGRLIIRWQLWMPANWCDVYPEEAIKLDNGVKTLLSTPGNKLQPSYASNLWRKQAGEFLAEALSAIRRTPFADRIAGIHLCHGNCGEWNHWGYHEEAFVDFSKPMQRAFGAWLKNKYQTADNLRKAWTDPKVDFSQDLVPSRSVRMEASTAVLRKLPQGMPAADYYEFFSRYTVATIEYFAKIVKSVSDHRLLAGAFYGYYIGHLSTIPFHIQDSGHYATGRYLESPWLDFLCGPYPYDQRLINAVPNGVCGSVVLHNKLWINENDQRTHRSGPSNIIYGTTTDEGESIAILRRDFMQNLSKKTSYYFYDFVFGWYCDAEFMRNVKRLRELDRFADSLNCEDHTQVAVFVNEAGIPYISNRQNSGLSGNFEMLTHQMDAAGAPWKLVLLSDLDKVDMSKIKLAIFPDAYALSEDDVERIHNVVCNNKRRVVWLYAPGLLNLETGNFDPELSKKLTGIGIRYEPSFTNKEPLSDMPGLSDKLTTKTPLEMISIDDSRAKVIGQFPNKLPGAAVRTFEDWRSAVICFPGLNSAWLQTLYKNNGVQVWKNEEHSIFHAYGPFVSLYTRKAGKTTLRFPRKVEIVYDLFENRVVGENKTFVTVDSPVEPKTIIYYAGDKAPLVKGGLFN